MRYCFVSASLLLASAACAAPIAKGPYLQNPTTKSIVVRWVTDTESAGTVEWWRDGHDHERISETKPAKYHRLELPALSPYTRYRYRVIDGRDQREGSFKTAALPGKSFKFVAYGDTRTNAKAHAAVLARVAKFEPDFILQTGDLVENGTNESQWTVFFNTAGSVLANTPYFPALGNHERKGAPYFKYFDVPRDYSFDYGSAHFTVLDSNHPVSELPAMDAWLKKDLAAHQDVRWRIVAFHHTPYTCVDIPLRRRLAEVLRKRLEPIFLAGKVQLVINGHDHTYQHHFANGIHYVVTGGGGAPLYKLKLDTPFTKAAKSAYHDCEIKVDKKKISIRAVEPDGKVIEKFSIDTP